MSGVVSETARVENNMESNNNYDTWLPMLIQLTDIPWSLNDVSKVLRLGRARQYCRTVSPQTIEKVCSLLQRPFLRIVYEAERLAYRYERCTRAELHTSIRLILSPSLAKGCLQVASKALLLYVATAEKPYHRSKRARSGLTFPVGQVFGWLVNARVSQRVYDSAAIFLAAALEYIAEETVYRAVTRITGPVDHVTPDMVEDCINSDPDLWSLYQPYVHLLSGRTSYGLIDTLDIYAVNRKGKSNTPSKGIEPCFATTCISSMGELRELVSRVQQRFSHLKQCKENRAFSQMAWLPGAVDTLFYFMKCFHDNNANNGNIMLTNKRSHQGLPPLTEWIRVASVHAEHRASGFVDEDDVRQAARLLMPFNNCNFRIFGPDSSLAASSSTSSTESERVFKIDLGLRMLLSGRHSVVPSALALIGNKGNSMDARGLTPLMYVCLQGQPSLVKLLLDSHVLLDTQVPKDTKLYPLIDLDLYSWTALSFAVSKGHLHICQMLLDAGAHVDGHADYSNGTETPLQMAVTAGNYDIVSLLCARGANINVTFPVGVGKLGFGNTFSAAAAFGHRKILRKLLADGPSVQDNEMMSLAEILDEGSPSSQRKAKPLNKKRCAALQEAMYHSCEHGYLDVAMEIRSLGVPWSLHCWSHALYLAYYINTTSSMTSQMRCLLRDFQSISTREYTAEFCDDGLVLLFTIFRECQDTSLYLELAYVFSYCFGDEPLPTINELPSTTPAIKIGANYVNNHEMSDVTFLVEGQPFYGHKIILASASGTFKDILSSKSVNGQESYVKIPDIKYDVFTLVMRYVYTGRTDKISVQYEKLLELLHAALVFKLDGLHRHCERLLAEKLDKTNIIITYQTAKKFEATSLCQCCECYILSNMKEISEHGELRTMVLNEEGVEVLKALQLCLSNRIKSRATKFQY